MKSMSAHDNEYDLLIIGGGINGAGIAVQMSIGSANLPNWLGEL